MSQDFETPWPGIDTAGERSLSFVNTLDWRLREPPAELLEDYADLLRWAWTVDAVDRAGARALLAWSRSHPRLAERALAQAIEVREAMAALFTATLRHEPIPAEALARLEGASRDAEAARRLGAGGGVLRWEWRESSPEPDRPVWTAALDAVRVLTSDDRERVRQCGDALCGWMFLDTSRNRSRRWCSMEGCGNRNKVRSFYKRAAEKQARRGGRKAR